MISGGYSGESLLFPLLPSDLWISGSLNQGLMKSRICGSARTMCQTALSHSWGNSHLFCFRAWVCVWLSGMGSVFFPKPLFYVLSMLTTWKRQWTYLQMTVIFRERKMANIRQKKYEVNFSPWRAKEIIRAVWQPQSPGTWPAPWLSHCYLYEPGFLSST